jgi:predicted dehydrogenase
MSFDVSWAANTPGENFVELLGTKGGMRIGDAPITLLTEVGDRIADIKLQYPDKGDPFAAEMEKFVAAVQGESEPAATGEQGVIAMKLIDAIYRSAAEGAEVHIE